MNLGGRRLSREKKRPAKDRDNETAVVDPAGFKQRGPALVPQNESGVQKKIMIFVGACLAVGLSMGIGFATFVNKNNNQTPVAQPNAYPPPSAISNISTPTSGEKKPSTAKGRRR